MVFVDDIDWQTRPAAEKNKRTSVPLLQSDFSVLLALPLRLQHLPGMYASKSLGDELQ